MIAATVHDPHLFDGLADLDVSRRASLIDHLAHVAHSHLMVLDRDGLLGQAMLSRLADLPPTIRSRLEAAIQPGRIVRLSVDAQKQADYEALLDRRETATALALNCEAIDSVITDEEGKLGVETIGGGAPDNLQTLPEFLLSDCHQRLLMTMGGVTLRDMPRGEFSENIVGPVLRWAKQIRIIDRHISTAYFEHNPDTLNQDSQWGRISATVKYLYDLWEDSCVVELDRFVIVTQPLHPDRWRQPWHNGQCPNVCKQAELIAETLDLGPRAQIEVIKVPAEVKALDHDRYLRSDRNIVLNFSKGFDLIRPNGMCGECTVSLNREASNETVLTLLEKSRTLATCRCGPYGWTAS